jgi:hypothetical protein
MDPKNENISKKTRVTRYCPKIDQIKFKLQCEWHNCDYISNDMDDYLKHIDNDHLTDESESKQLF